MKVNEKLQQLGIDPNTADFSDILSSLEYTADSLALKKDEVGTDLISLVAFTNTNRTLLAETLDYKKSRITRILSGMENLTLRTIHDVCKAVGYDFDIIFRKNEDKKPMQPWQSVETIFSNTATLNMYRHIGKPVQTTTISTSYHQVVANDATWNSLELAAA